MDSTITRFGNLGRVFKEGESEALNGVARLSVLYEDLRLELNELKQLAHKLQETGKVEGEFRVAYFMRRALVTLVEFRRGLTMVRKTAEFKQAQPFLPNLHSKSLLEADQYFQQNEKRIKEFRNEFGGHVQSAGIGFATKHLSNVVGSVAWNRSSDGWTIGLECHFAADLVSGAITSRLVGGADVKDELTKAMHVIIEGFNHVQAATCALVHAFLWDRFGT